jgi:uncharacterized HAD superfamily protein
MKTTVKKQVCLLMNLGGFEVKQEDHLEMASRYGEIVYSLSENGIADSDVTPANVLAMTTEELMKWSEVINREIHDRGLSVDNVVVLVGGRNTSGILSLGTIIKQNIRIGA